MSLDVYLVMDNIIQGNKPEPKIFIREGGQTREITRAQWDERFPGREPLTVEYEDDSQVYSANITHNLGKMADEAGIYQALWRPEEIAATQAYQLVAGLEQGLNNLLKYPDHFKELNPKNGWGDYDGLVEFVQNYLKACKEYPEARVKVSR